MMEEDSAIAWDSELNAAFWDEAAAPLMPSSSCQTDRDSNTTPAAPGCSTPTEPAVTKASSISTTPATSKTAPVAGTPAAPAVSVASGTPARRPGHSARSTPRVRCFLYPAASQIARDTPDRRRLPRSVTAPRTPRTPAEQRQTAATVTALTPAEQRDVQACLAMAMETLEDDGEAFFTQCRVSVPPDGSEAEPAAAGGAAGRVEHTPSAASASGQFAPSSANIDSETMETGSAAVRLVASAIRPLTAHALKDSSKPTTPPAAPGSAPSVDRRRTALGSFSSEHRTPAGRPVDRSGRVPPAKRLWSAADEAESEEDEPGCSPVLSSHKKRRRHERRPAPTATLRSPMTAMLLENMETDMTRFSGDDKTENPANLAPPKLERLPEGSDCWKLAGFGTAAGRKIIVSEEAIQKAVTLLREPDASADDCDLLDSAAACAVRLGCGGEKPRDGSGAVPGSSAPDKVDAPMNTLTRGMDGRICGPPVPTAGSSEAIGHGDDLNVGFHTASGKKLAISNEAVRLARAKFTELDETTHSDELFRLGREGHRPSDGNKPSDGGKRRLVADFQPVTTSLGQVKDGQCSSVSVVVASSATISTATEQIMEGGVKVCPKQVEPSSKHLTANIAPRSSAMGICQASTSLPKPVCVTVEADVNPCDVSKPAQFSSPALSALRMDGSRGDIRGPRVSGFQTAGGKKVAVSEKALARAKVLFDDIDDGETNMEPPHFGAPKIFPTSSTHSTSCPNAGCAEAAVAEVHCPADSPTDTHRLGASCSSDPPSASRPPGADNKPNTSSTSQPRAQWDGGGICGNWQRPPGDSGSGFATAPGRSLVVSGAALKAAGRVPESVAPANMRCESPTVADSERSDDTAETAQLRASEMRPDDGRDMSLGVPEDREVPKKEHPCGFVTAGGRPVKISEAALKKAKALFDSDIHCESVESGKHLPCNFKPPCDSEVVGDQVDDMSTGGNTEGRMQLTESVQHQLQTSCAFVTASGKSVKEFQSSLNKASAMLEETMEADSSAERTLEHPCDSTTAGGKPEMSKAAIRRAQVMLDDETVGRDMEEKKPTEREERPCGFVTASGKPVDISEAALQKAKTLHDSDTVFDTVRGKCFAKPALERPCGFATADEQPVEMAEATIIKTKATFGEDTVGEAMDVDLVQPEADHFCGFATAGGNPVMISEAALKKAKTLLDCEYVHEATETDLTKSEKQQPRCFGTASGKSVKISEAALKEAKATLDRDASETMEVEESAEPQMERPIGFATASGRPVEISEAALQKAKALLDSDDSKTLNVEKPAEPRIKRPDGFATASGRRVKVSEAALKKAKALLDSGNDYEAREGQSEEPAIKRPCGFATASGKSVKVSEAALKKAKALLDSDDVETLNVEKTAEPQMKRPDGFATASGNPVKVSEGALKKAKALLDSDDFEAREEASEEPAIKRPCGFATASGKSVKVSEAALKKAKAMLDSDDRETLNLEKPVEPQMKRLDGFATASGRPMKVSEDALKKAKAVLVSDILKATDENNCKELQVDHLCGLAIVGEKFLHASEAATREAKAILDSGEGATEASVPDTGIRPAPTEGPSAPSGTAHPTADRTAILRPALDGPATERGQGDSERCRADSELASAGLTQVLDERFEFTQVVAERHRHAEEERSASPVLGTARRHRTVRRRTSEPAVFRTPYRSAPARRTAAARSAASPTVPPTRSTATASPVTAAPQLDATSSSGVQESRAEARRRAAELAAGGAERRVTRSVGSLLQCRLGTDGADGPRTSLRGALGPRPASLTRDELLSLDVPADVLDVTFASAASYRFRCTQATMEVDGCEVVPADDDTVGVAEVRSALLSCPGVQPSLVPENWVQNAFRLIVWKLAAYERQFPDEMAGRCLTVEQLVRQLRYRYDRELDRCQRPALRRITEGDDTAAKTLILCLAEVNTTAGGVRLVVSDGWYCVPAQGDAALQRLARLGRLRPGLKLAVHGAELVGQQNPCSPLEASADLCLRFSTNSCRRARWDARLGYHSNPAPFASSLSAVLPDGGSVARLDTAIARVYPVLYYGKEEGVGVFRTVRCERRRAAAAEAARQARLERLYAAVERQLGSQERPAAAARCPVGGAAVRQLSTGQQIYECVAAAADPAAVESLLTDQQRQLAAEYQRGQRERHREKLEAELRARLQREPEADRPATPLIKVRLAGRDGVPASGAILTLWRPSDELQAFLVEGRSVSLYGVTANGKRSGVLQLSAGSQLRVQRCAAPLNAPPRRLAPLDRLATEPLPYGELDLAALVVDVTQGTAPAGSQTVQLADRTGSLLSVVCWPGLKPLGLDDLVVAGAVLGFANLQLCSASARPPLCALTDRAEVSRRPSAPHLADELHLLTAQNCADLAATARSALASALVVPPAYSRTSSAAESREPAPSGAAPVTPSGAGAGSAQWSVTPTGAGGCRGGGEGDGADGDSARPAQRRLQALLRYGPAPPISPLVSPLPARLRRPFRSPRPTGGHTPGGTAAVSPRGGSSGAAAANPGGTSGAAAATPGGTSSADVGPGGGDGAGAAAEIIRLSELGSPAAAVDSPPIEPDSQAA